MPTDSLRAVEAVGYHTDGVARFLGIPDAAAPLAETVRRIGGHQKVTSVARNGRVKTHFQHTYASDRLPAEYADPVDCASRLGCRYWVRPIGVPRSTRKGFWCDRH